MAKELVARNEVPEELTWDLSSIYATEEDMYADLYEMEAEAKRIVEQYQGKLMTPEAINGCLEAYHKVVEKMTLTGNYADLAVSVDYYDGHNQERNAKVNRVISEVFSELSFIQSEIVAQSEEVLNAAVEQATACKGYLKEILRNKPHQLHPEAERVLAAYGPTMNVPYEVYNNAKLADMKFPSFTVNGETYPLGYSLYEDDYSYDPRTDVRRAAFDAFSAKLREYENVTATAYNAQVQK